MFGITSSIKYIVAAAAFCLVIVVTLWYISNIKANLAISQENNKQLLASIDKQKEVIDRLRKEQQMISQINKDLAIQIKKQNDDIQSLKNRLKVSANNQPRDIGELAYNKPKLIERIINNASKNALRCLEIVSGSELTEEEKNGKSNSECPSITSN